MFPIIIKSNLTFFHPIGVQCALSFNYYHVKYAKIDVPYSNKNFFVVQIDLNTNFLHYFFLYLQAFSLKISWNFERAS